METTLETLQSFDFNGSTYEIKKETGTGSQAPKFFLFESQEMLWEITWTEKPGRFQNLCKSQILSDLAEIEKPF